MDSSWPFLQWTTRRMYGQYRALLSDGVFPIGVPTLVSSVDDTISRLSFQMKRNLCHYGSAEQGRAHLL